MNEFIKYLKSLNYGDWLKDSQYLIYERKKTIFNFMGFALLILGLVWLGVYLISPTHSISGITPIIGGAGLDQKGNVSVRPMIYGLLTLLAWAGSYMCFYYKFFYSNQMKDYAREKKEAVSRKCFDNPQEFKKYMGHLVDYSFKSKLKEGELKEGPPNDVRDINGVNVIEINAARDKKLKASIEDRKTKLLIMHLDERNYKFFNYQLHEFVEPIWREYSEEANN